jgi:hypothetical protein
MHVLVREFQIDIGCEPGSKDKVRVDDARLAREVSLHKSALLTLLSVALLAAAGCSNVSLTQYYVRVPPGTQIDIDPMGGYMLLYWVDPSGTACHGAPGLSGQPGPAAITVAKTAAIQDASGGSSVTAAQLSDYQTIPYTVSDYRQSGAAGYHFFQFDNILWRQRRNGQAFRDSADHFYSVPQVINVDNAPATLFPAYAWGRSECDRAQFSVIPQGVLDGPAQHPTQCRVKSFPSSGALAEDVLLSYCVKRLPQGSRYREY